MKLRLRKKIVEDENEEEKVKMEADENTPQNADDNAAIDKFELLGPTTSRAMSADMAGDYPASRIGSA